MKRQIEQDERIIEQNRKVLSEAYSLLMAVLILSLPIQQFILHAPFEQYAVEFFCFFGASVYILARKVMLGLNIFGGKNNTKRIMLINCTVTGITVTVVSGILNYARNTGAYAGRMGEFIATLAVTFISAYATSFAVLLGLSYINGKRQKRIQEKLDIEELGEE